MHTKRFNTFFKRWVHFRAGAIPRLLFLTYKMFQYVLFLTINLRSFMILK